MIFVWSVGVMKIADGTDVAVNDPLAVPLGECVRELDGKLECQACLDRLPGQERAQRLPRDELVSQEDLAVLLTEVEQRGDVRV